MLCDRDDLMVFALVAEGLGLGFVDRQFYRLWLWLSAQIQVVYLNLEWCWLNWHVFFVEWFFLCHSSLFEHFSINRRFFRWLLLHTRDHWQFGDHVKNGIPAIYDSSVFLISNLIRLNRDRITIANFFYTHDWWLIWLIFRDYVDLYSLNPELLRISLRGISKLAETDPVFFSFRICQIYRHLPQLQTAWWFDGAQKLFSSNDGRQRGCSRSVRLRALMGKERETLFDHNQASVDLCDVAVLIDCWESFNHIRQFYAHLIKFFNAVNLIILTATQ